MLLLLLPAPKTELVTEFGTPELAQLTEDMWDTMVAANGAGLAANQVGISRRVFVAVGETVILMTPPVYPH